MASKKLRKKDPAVHHPKHYNKGGIETIAYIKTRLTPAEYKGWLRGTVLKYVDRAPDKKAERQDYEKAMFYIEELLKLLP